MANPVRFPSGVSVYPPRNILNTFPAVPNANQSVITNEFLPFRGTTDFTVTQTNGTGASYPWLDGAVSLATTGTTNADKIFFSLGATANSQSMMYIPGNQSWTSVSVAVPSTISDVNMYIGEFDAQDPSGTVNNGIYFLKPAGGTTVNLVIKKAGTTTTFTNIADLAKPSGLYNGSDSGGTLTANTSGTTLTSIAVTTPGSGYQVAPLIIVNGTGGSGAGAYCQLGSGSLYAPYITAPGSGYTAGTFTFSILPWVSFQKYYDGKGTLYIGVNGRPVMSIGPSGQTAVVPGNTYSNASFTNFTVSSGTLLSGIPVIPKTGAVDHMIPQLPMYSAGGFKNTTANARTAYVDQYNIAFEYN